DNVKILGLSWLIKEGNFLYNFFLMIMQSGFMVMRYLAVFFAIGVSMGLSKREKGWGALAGFVMYLGTNYMLNVYMGIQGISEDGISVEALMEKGYSRIDAQKENSLYGNVLGIFTYNTSIFGALATAFMASFIHNKLWDKELRPALSFFGGVRLVQLAIVAASIPMGILFYYIWPVIGHMIQNLGVMITNTGLFGTFVFGALDRSLLPLGLHHLIAFPIEYTPLSGTMEFQGTEYYGVRNIMTAQLADPDATGFITRNFTTGRVLMHFAGLPAAALAIYHSAQKKNRKKLKSLLIPVTLTTILIGVTEPLEFTFVYTAPLLYYIIHVPLAGLSYVLTEAMDVSIYGFAVWNMWPNLLQPDKVHALALILLLPIYFILYYFGFKFGISRFNSLVPGREDEEDTVKLYSKKDYVEGQNIQAMSPEMIERIIAALGGKENILNVTNCATRLRVELRDASLRAPKEVWTQELQASGVIGKEDETSIQVVYGTRVEGIARTLKTLLNIE
ncbi:MAG: PTS transporter subunit EIIC, partial [Spirochaetota bacterium]